MNDDWRYSNDRMLLRELALSTLLKSFGSDLDKNGEPVYSMRSIVECAHDWVSQGNDKLDGIESHFQTHYV